MDNRKVAQQVIERLGGKENITNALHCVTRLRFNVKEDAKVNGAAIEAIDGVMGMQIKNGQYQIIIGPMVADVFLEVEDLLGHSGSEAPKTRMGNVLDIITGIFSAILPALVAGGMLKGILAMLEAMGMSSGGGTWTVFSVISDVPFYFLPFLLLRSRYQAGCHVYFLFQRGSLGKLQVLHVILFFLLRASRPCGGRQQTSCCH